jgi:hypothetical protein
VLAECLTRDLAAILDVPLEFLRTEIHPVESWRDEDFIEMLGPEAGYNLRHPHYEGQHLTGEACPCGPTRIVHAIVPPAEIDDDAEFGEDDLPTVDEALRMGWPYGKPWSDPTTDPAKDIESYGPRGCSQCGGRTGRHAPGCTNFDGDASELGRGIAGF